MAGGMELHFFGLWIFKFRSLKFGKKIALSAEFQVFSWKFRPLKTLFRTLENGHSIRHQSIPPLSAGRHRAHAPVFWFFYWDDLFWKINRPEFLAAIFWNQMSPFPKNLLRLLFASRNLFFFYFIIWGYLFKDPQQKYPVKKALKITSRGYF